MTEVVLVFNKRIWAQYPESFLKKEDFFEDGNDFYWKADAATQWELFSAITLPILGRSGLLLVNDGSDDYVDYSNVVEALTRTIDTEQVKVYVCYHNRSKSKWKDLKIEYIFLISSNSMVDFSNLKDDVNCQKLYDFYEGKTDLPQLVDQLFGSISHRENSSIIQKCLDPQLLPEVEKMLEKKAEGVWSKFADLKNTTDGPLGDNYSKALKCLRDELFQIEKN